MRRRLKKLIGITTAAAMAVSLVPTTVFAEEPVAAIAEETRRIKRRSSSDKPSGCLGRRILPVGWRLPLQYQCSDELLADTGK